MDEAAAAMQVSSEISGRNRDANQPDDDSDPKKPNLFNVNEEEEDNKSDNYTNRVYTIDDDSYESDPDWMTREEALRHQQEVIASDGFDIGPFECRFWMSSGISPTPLRGETLVSCTACAKLALDSYNKDKNTNFEFVDLEKANWALSSYIEYYITFKARDGNAGAVKTFQAHVAEPCARGLKVEVQLCRLKPGEEDASASTKPSDEKA